MIPFRADFASQPTLLRNDNSARGQIELRICCELRTVTTTMLDSPSVALGWTPFLEAAVARRCRRWPSWAGHPFGPRLEHSVDGHRRGTDPRAQHRRRCRRWRLGGALQTMASGSSAFSIVKVRFVRRASHEGNRAEAHTLAANIDVVFLMHGLNSPPNQRRLERELVLAFDSGARPIVVMSKSGSRR